MNGRREVTSSCIPPMGTLDPWVSAVSRSSVTMRPRSSFKLISSPATGNVTKQTLTHRDGVWTWQGQLARCTGKFSEDRKTLTAHHERLDGTRWVPSMEVTLRKID